MGLKKLEPINAQVYDIRKRSKILILELELLKEFIDASPETLGGSLANAIVLRPFICWENCQIQLQPMNEGKIVIGETTTVCAKFICIY